MKLNKLDHKKETSTLKSHEEILELLEEIKSIEDKLKDPEKLQVNSIENETVERDMNKAETTTEKTNELQSSIVQADFKDELQIEKDKKKKNKIYSLIRLRKKKKSKKSKIKNFFRRREIKPDENNVLETVESTNLVKGETRERIKPTDSTFTLHINNQGDLVGFNIKKHNSPSLLIKELIVSQLF